MSNVVVHDFPERLELELFQVREVLRCVLHTVLFHRTLGVVRPRDAELSLFDVIYVRCCAAAATLQRRGQPAHLCSQCSRSRSRDPSQVQVEDAEVERTVESRIDDLCAWLEKHAERQEATVRRRSLLSWHH